MGITARKLVAPSLLSADFSKLGQEMADLERAGADWFHIDVMDGHFVPNLTMGPPVIQSLRAKTRLPLDVHLMISNPEEHIEAYAKAGSDYMTLHIETLRDPRGALKRVRDLGAKPGLTLRPRTELSKILPFLNEVDLVLVMTVEPGFSGQSFMMSQVSKIQELLVHREKGGLSYLIEVDGGINADTARLCAGVDVLVSGHFVLKGDYGAAIRALKGEA